jgi:hypothetical protein
VLELRCDVWVARLRWKSGGKPPHSKLGEEHVGGGLVAAAAVVEVEDEIVFGDEVAREEAEFGGGAIYGGWWTLQLDEGACGGFGQFDQEAGGPFMARGKFVRGAEFFVAEPAAKAEAFEDFLECGCVGEDEFGFFADFVAVLPRWRVDGEGFGRGFEGEEIAGRRFARGFFFGRGRFGANAEELTVFGETTVGCVEEKIHFVDARGFGVDGDGAEAFQSAQEGFGIGDGQLDFDFLGHEGSLEGAWESGKLKVKS